MKIIMPNGPRCEPPSRLPAFPGDSGPLVTASEGNIDEGSVSCLSVSVCVATTDNGLWVTRNDGGLTG